MPAFHRSVRRAATGLLVAGAFAAAALAQDGGVDIGTVLDRAQAYVGDYEEQLGMIIGEEEYVQDATWLEATVPPRVAERERRRLRSDFLLLPVGERWYGVRSVRSVDGVGVDAPETFPESPEEIIRNRTDTAYNIGDFARTFNVPTFALTLLRAENVSRFEFEKRGEPRVDGVPTWEIEFTETTSPTLVRGTNGANRYARGRFWIRPDTGAVVRTEVAFEAEAAGTPYRATMRVGYESNAALGMLVPGMMEEHYSSEFHSLDARADYSNFKRFSVQVDQSPGAVVQ